jgi:hypothetical protein
MGDRTAAPVGAQDGISERCLMRSRALMPTSIPMPLQCRGTGSSAGSGPRTVCQIKIHHAAFDAHLIGVDPDYRIHVSDRLLGCSKFMWPVPRTRPQGDRWHIDQVAAAK